MHIVDLLSKFGWAFTLIGLILTYGYFVANKKRGEKAFSYRVLTDTQLVTVSDEAVSDVQISFKGNPVDNVRLLEVEFRNTGIPSIAAADFDVPAKIVLPKGSQIIEAIVTDYYPKDRTPNVVARECEVELVPYMMNGGNWVKIKVLASIVTANVHFSAHIKDVPKLTPYRDDRAASFKLKRLLLLSVAVGLIVFGFFQVPGGTSWGMRGFLGLLVGFSIVSDALIEYISRNKNWS